MRYPRFFKRVRAATPENVMLALADFATQVPADQEIVELGVFQGRSALMMAWGARQGHGAHVTGIDPWELPGNVYDPPFTEDASRRWAQHWVQSLGYSTSITLVQDFSHNVAARWGGPKVGLLYVDGDHTKEGARRDIEAWAPHLAPGARIAVDDYGHPDWCGVRLAVDELVDEGFLEPVVIYHDRLAVTRLKGEPETPTAPAVTPDSAPAPAEPPTAITGEGVSPSPYPAAPGQVAEGPGTPVDQPAADPEPVPVVVDTDTSSDPEPVQPPVVTEPEPVKERPEPRREVVSLEESLFLEDSRPGQPIGELKVDQLRELAKRRGIVLGARKDKKGEIIQALKDGR